MNNTTPWISMPHGSFFRSPCLLTIRRRINRRHCKPLSTRQIEYSTKLNAKAGQRCIEICKTADRSEKTAKSAQSTARQRTTSGRNACLAAVHPRRIFCEATVSYLTPCITWTNFKTQCSKALRPCQGRNAFFYSVLIFVVLKHNLCQVVFSTRRYAISHVGVHFLHTCLTFFVYLVSF